MAEGVTLVGGSHSPTMLSMKVSDALGIAAAESAVVAVIVIT